MGGSEDFILRDSALKVLSLEGTCLEDLCTRLVSRSEAIETGQSIADAWDDWRQVTGQCKKMGHCILEVSEVPNA